MANNQYQYGRSGVLNSEEVDMNLHRAGKKFAGSHTTIIEEAAKIIDATEKMPEVSKIVLGPIRNMKGLKLSVKFTEIGAGWKVVICGKSARQELFFYTDDRAKVQTELFSIFPELEPESNEKKTK